MKNLSTGITLLLIAVLFLIAIALSNLIFSGARLDLTEDGLHTLSKGTVSTLENLEEPVKLRLYYSRADAQSDPGIRARARQIIDMLKEFDAAGGDKLTVEYRYPEPFSDDAQQAAKFQLQPIGAGQYNTPIYLGIVATNSLDGQGVISQLSQRGGMGNYRDNAEYEVAKVVYELSHPKKRKIGVITSLPMLGVPNAMPAAGQTGEWQTPPWLMVQVVEQLFVLDNLGPSPASIPDDLDALWIVHPKNLSDSTLFAIDQYVLNGGPTLIFVDPSTEADQAGGPMDAALDHYSDIPPLFEAWGLEYDPTQVIVDADYAMAEANNNPVFLRLVDDALNREDLITADVNGRVNAGLVGSLKYVNEASESTTFTPLLYSSNQSGLVATNSIANATPAQLLQRAERFDVNTDQRHILAARLSGELSSAFNSAPETFAGEFKASGDAQVLVVADTEILTDQFWYQMRQGPQGQLIPVQPWAANDALVIGALSTFAGGSDLLSIRARSTHRSFEVIENARREALRIAEKKQAALQKKLDESNQVLQRLLQEAVTQTGRLDGEAYLAQQEEAEAKVAEFESEINKINYDLIKANEKRRMSLMVLTMLVVPIVLILVAIVVAIRRSRLRASRSIN